MADPAWDAQVDVVALGGGGAGLRAAYAAAEAGASTLLLEKMPQLGGKTAMSIGILTASGTSVQKRAGVRDSHARHLADIEAMGEKAGVAIDVPATKFMIRECSREIDNLVALGVEFSGPHPEGPHGTPRVHVVQPDCRRLVEILGAACARAGVRVETGVTGADLILDHKGRVAGVVAGTNAPVRRIQAGAVVLAAGDYSANRAFLSEVAPKALLAPPIRNFATGDGHRMAMRIGAATRNMQQVNTPHLRFTEWPYVEPSPGLFDAGALLVTTGGERVDVRAGQSAELPGYEDRPEDFFIVIDDACRARLATSSDDRGPGRDGWSLTGKPFIGTAPRVGYAYLEDCRDWDWYFATNDTGAAARHIGFPPAALDACSPGTLHILGPTRRVLANSGGGLSTNQRMNVLSQDGRPIRGLYGAGVNARLITFMGGHGYASPGQWHPAASPVDKRPGKPYR